MHKRRAQTAGTGFYTACLIWVLVVYVLLQISVYNPQASIHLGAPAGPAAAAAGARAAGVEAAAAGHTAAAPPLTSLREGTEKSHGDSSITPHAEQQLVLGPQTFAGSSMVVVTSTTAPYIEW